MDLDQPGRRSLRACYRIINFVVNFSILVGDLNEGIKK